MKRANQAEAKKGTQENEWAKLGGVKSEKKGELGLRQKRGNDPKKGFEKKLDKKGGKKKRKEAL